MSITYDVLNDVWEAFLDGVFIDSDTDACTLCRRLRRCDFTGSSCSVLS